MNSKRIISSLMLALGTILTVNCHAQRTMQGNIITNMEGAWTGSGPAAEISAGKYTIGGLWDTGITGRTYMADVINEADAVSMQYAHICAKASYLHRLIATRSRGLNLYAGAEVFAGAEMDDPFKKIATMERGNTFIYGLSPALEIETYIGRRLAVILNAKAPVSFSSRYGAIRYQIGAALRIVI